MYNLRYHVVSLMAVFLALAVGLVLGGLAVGGGMLDEQQDALVSGLQDEFTTLRDENRSLSEDNKALTAFSKDVIEAWSAERLVGHTVVVLTAEGMDDSVTSVRDAVEQAGGAVAVVTMLEPEFGLAEAQSGSIAASFSAGADDPVSSVAAQLAHEWSMQGTARPLTAELVDAGAIKVESLPAEPGKVCLVSVAGDEGRADQSGVALLKAFSVIGPTLGAEMHGTDTGVAAAASKAGAAGMDTLGTPVGDYTVVAVLSGSHTGYFGSALTAKDLYPAISLR